MTREQARKLGPAILGLWIIWEQFIMRDGKLIRKLYIPGKDGYQELIVVSKVAKRSVVEQMHDSKPTGTLFALHKTLDRTQQRFWWPIIRRDIDKWIKSCKPNAERSTMGRNLKAESLPVTVGVRFAEVAVDILGPANPWVLKPLSAEELATRTRVETIRNNTDRNFDLLVAQIS